MKSLGVFGILLVVTVFDASISTTNWDYYDLFHKFLQAKVSAHDYLTRY